MEQKDLKKLMLGLNCPATKLGKEFGLFYDEKSKAYWFGEKKKADD